MPKPGFGAPRSTRRSRETRSPVVPRARELREEQTRAEQVLWERLRDRRFLGLKFRRQFPVEGFIADFYCHEQKLIVEVDGLVHAESSQREHDENRDIVLRRLGIQVLRVSNADVMEALDSVLHRIARSAKVSHRLSQ